MSAEPPRLFRWLIGGVCPPSDRPFVLSDLDEEFHATVAASGPARARLWYRSQVIRSLGPCLARRLVERRRKHRRVWPTRTSLPEWARELAGDAGYAVRSLRHDLLLVGVTLGSIGIGVGIVATIFAVASSTLLRPPGAVGDPDDLFAVYTADPGANRYAETSFPDHRDIAREIDAFSATAAWRAGGLTLRDGLGEQRLLVEVVSHDYFRVLQVQTALGRDFDPDETVVGAADAVAVISHALWTDRYAGSPDVLGRIVQLDEREFTIIGVAPEKLRGRFLEAKVDVWVPIGIPGGTSRSTDREIMSRQDRDYGILARLAEGASAVQAQGQLDGLASRLRAEHPEAWSDDRGERGFSILVGAESSLPPGGRTALGGLALFLMLGGGFVLLLACTNVAGLFLARGDRRRREIAIRFSMGASRGRILRLLLIETLLLALASGLVGLAITAWASGLVGRTPLPLDVPIRFSVRAHGTGDGSACDRRSCPRRWRDPSSCSSPPVWCCAVSTGSPTSTWA